MARRSRLRSGVRSRLRWPATSRSTPGTCRDTVDPRSRRTIRSTSAHRRRRSPRSGTGALSFAAAEPRSQAPLQFAPSTLTFRTRHWRTCAVASLRCGGPPGSSSQIAHRGSSWRRSGNLTRDHILDNITLYWLTGTGVSRPQRASGLRAPVSGSQPMGRARTLLDRGSRRLPIAPLENSCRRQLLTTSPRGAR
jgi:hypothetical protein